LGLAHQALGQLDSAEYFFKQGVDISLAQNESKEDILFASDGLLDTFNHLLDLSKNKANPLSIHPNRFRLKGLLDKIQYTLMPIVKTKELTYTQADHFEEALEITTDAQKLETVLLTLLTNAIKFTDANDTILLQTTEQEQTIELAVIDTGQGIHQSDMPFLFDRYFQSPQNKDTLKGGIGIGLAICKEYVQLLGGSISATSKIEEGSSFTITLPKVLHTDLPIEPIVFPQRTIKVANESLLASKEGQPPTEKASLLIIEDNLEMCRYLKAILEESYDLQFAYSGRTALKFLKTNELPHLIITDWMMLDMDGIELTEKINNIPSFADIPIIMLTARNLAKDQALALYTGVDDYLIKPFDVTVLKSSIHRLLQHSIPKSASNIYFETPVKLKASYAILQNGITSSISKKEYDWLVQVEHLIYANLSDFNLNTTFVAEQLFLTTASLNRKIKQLTGFTTKKYIQEIRYWEARDLLEKGVHDTIKAVSISVGFKDSKTFSRNFKERFGRSPAEYFKNE